MPRKTRRRYHGKKTRKRGGDPGNNISKMSNEDYDNKMISIRLQIENLIKEENTLDKNNSKKNAIERHIKNLLESMAALRENKTGIKSLIERKKEIKGTQNIEELKELKQINTILTNISIKDANRKKRFNALPKNLPTPMETPLVSTTVSEENINIPSRQRRVNARASPATDVNAQKRKWHYQHLTRSAIEKGRVEHTTPGILNRIKGFIGKGT